MKSVGAERKDIQKSIITDTFVHLLLAVFVGIVFVVAFHKVFYQILQIRVSELISPTSILLGIVILIVTGFVISVGPGRIIASQPVISVMTNYKKTNRRWKLSLLFIESIGVTFLLCTVFFVHHQYNYSVRLDKGYNTDKVYYIPTSAIDSLGIKSITDILRDSPEVEVVSLGSTLPFHNQSGDNIFDPESGKDILHIKDFFWCDKYYLEASRYRSLRVRVMIQSRVMPRTWSSAGLVPSISQRTWAGRTESLARRSMSPVTKTLLLL